jgi:hypothetical protein
VKALRVIGALCLLFPFPSPGFTLEAEPSKAVAAYEEALLLYGQEKYVASAERLFSVLKEFPDSSEAKKASYLFQNWPSSALSDVDQSCTSGRAGGLICDQPKSDWPARAGSFHGSPLLIPFPLGED